LPGSLTCAWAASYQHRPTTICAATCWEGAVVAIEDPRPRAVHATPGRVARQIREEVCLVVRRLATVSVIDAQRIIGAPDWSTERMVRHPWACRTARPRSRSTSREEVHHPKPLVA
jgi:hypothetical protein